MAPICDGGCRSVAYVLFEKLPCSLVGFGRSSTSLSLSPVKRYSRLASQGESLAPKDGKESGGLGLGHTALVDSLDYLLAEVFGVGFHRSMIACRLSVLISAVHGDFVHFLPHSVGWVVYASPKLTRKKDGSYGTCVTNW